MDTRTSTPDNTKSVKPYICSYILDLILIIREWSVRELYISLEIRLIDFIYEEYLHIDKQIGFILKYN